MAIPSKILIVGATGSIGKIITEALLGAKPPVADQISILTSTTTASGKDKEALLSSWKSQGLSVITGDINNAEDVSKAYQGFDTVVSCLGRGSLAVQTELVRVAEETESVEWFFPSEYGTDIEYDATSKDEKPHQMKLKVRAFIRDHVKRVKCTYLVTGPWIDFFLDLRPPLEMTGGYDVTAQRAVVVVGDDGSDGQVGFTSMSDVGKLMVAALRHPEEAMGQILRVQSFVTTPKTIVEEFKKQTGADWRVEETKLSDLGALEKKMWDAGNPVATGATLRRIWASGRTLYDKTDNEKLGLKDQDMESLSSAVERHIGEAKKSKL
ncbi:hypothetical protein F5Y16DRAFT_413446 [Xylariaceae sp. FL0255]|nr:hypothetical protein F5Y16DRAFT_413446 [Xylariaceae sp. FL0255]